MQLVKEQMHILTSLQVFWWVFALLFIDLISGVVRGYAEHGFIWSRFYGAFVRASYYFFAFCFFLIPGVFYTLTGVVFPLWTLKNVDLMWLVVVKELISILQNIKGYFNAKQKESKLLDLLIDFLRLNAFHIVLETIKAAPNMAKKPKLKKYKYKLDKPQET